MPTFFGIDSFVIRVYKKYRLLIRKIVRLSNHLLSENRVYNNVKGTAIAI